MMYVGVDFGQKTGLAVLTNGLADVDTLFLPAGPESEGQRYALLRAALEGVAGHKLASEVVVVFEEPAFFRGAGASKQNAGYRAITMAFCEQRGISYASVPVATIKKFASEVSGIDPDEDNGKLVGAALSHDPTLGPIDDNGADAYWLAVYGEQALDWGVE